MQEKTISQLINNVVGQLNGINKMIEKDADCIAVTSQMKAAKSALNSLMSKYLKQNANNCLSKVENKDSALLSKLIDELSNN